MKKTVLTFGLISGAVAALLMNSLVFFADRIGFDRAVIVGYTTIVVSLLLVPFGISVVSRKRWRRQHHFRPSLRGWHSHHASSPASATSSPGRSSTSTSCQTSLRNTRPIWSRKR